MNDIIEHNFCLDRNEFEKLNGHKSIVLWLTGLSGSGKSTIANSVQKELLKLSRRCIILDGDSVRTGLCKDLAFSQDERLENLRRVSEVARLFCLNGNIVIASFISPLASQRELIEQILKKDYHEIFIDADLEVCESRDPKGLYKKARSGEIKNFTGIDSEYEKPESPKLTIDTKELDLGECTKKLVNYINKMVEL